MSEVSHSTDGSEDAPQEIPVDQMPSILETVAPPPEHQYTGADSRRPRRRWAVPAGIALSAAVGIGAFVATRGEEEPPLAPTYDPSETTADTTQTSIDTDPQELTSFNGYTPSVDPGFSQSEIESGNLENYFGELLESEALQHAAETYGLTLEPIDYGLYGGGDNLVADYAWLQLFPNTYVDTEPLRGQTLSQQDIEVLAPVYIHNYLISLNTQSNNPVFPEIHETMPDHGYIYKPTEQTYVQNVTILEGFERETQQSVFVIEGLAIPVDVVDIEQITSIEGGGTGGTAPNEWEFRPLQISVSKETGQVVGYNHEAFELNT